jgi:hypothetical protein
MKKLFAFFVLLVLCQASTMAQVSTYTFSQSMGTYTEITGGVLVAEATGTSGATGLDDVIYTMPDGTIPFDFYFNGIPYTGFKISSNGFITFGATLPGTTTYTPISATLAYDGAVSAVGRDLIGRFGFIADRTLGSNILTNVNSFVGLEVGQLITGTGIPANTNITALDVGNQTVTLSQEATSTGAGATYVVPTGSIRVETLGSAPNRVVVIQWKRFSKFTGPGDEFNFQIRIYETTNIAESIYGSFISNATNASPQVGLRGAANSDFNNRTTTTDWTASTPGATNTANMTLTATVFPPGGLTFTWTPPNFPPFIDYTPLGNTAQGGNRNLDGVLINDPDGIATGSLAPRVYWRVNAGAWQSAATTSTSNPYSFVIGTAGLVQGDVVEYFVVAQDLLGVVGANPSAGFSATDVNNIISYPTTPNSYNIVQTLSGTFTVGTGETYPNLTAISSLLNNVVVTGNVIFELTNNYDGTTGETLPIVFGSFTTEASRGEFTVTIRPAAGVTDRVTSGDPGSNFAFPVINFVGASNYIFDGRPGGTGSSNEWTIRNTRAVATIGCVIRFADDATNNTLRNLNLEGQATLTTTGVIFFHTSTGTEGNSFNSILNNNIRGRTDIPSAMSNGILSNGSAAAPNSNNFIMNNHINNFNNIGISLVATNTGNGPGWTISDNHFYNSTVSTSTQTGISIASAASVDMVISGNFIGGDSPGATGTWTNSGAGVIITGIALTNGIASITGNTIANISGTGTGTAARTRGILYTSANSGIEITDNTIFNLTTMSTATGLTAGNNPVVGIHVFPGSEFYSSVITGNTIYNLSAENTTALTTSNVPAGVFLTNFTGVFANNRIYDIKNKSIGTTVGQPPIACGVYARFLSQAFLVNNMISLGSGENTNTQFNGIMVVQGTSANIGHYLYNSIAVTGTSGGDFGSFGFLRGDNTTTSPGTTVNFINNAVYNDRTGGGSVNHAIGSQGTTAVLNFNSDFNLLFNSNPATVGLLDATSYDFSGWKTALGGDAASYSPSALNGANLFTNIAAGDLNVLAGNEESWYLNGNGNPLALVDSDFNGNPRSTAHEDGATDIGAVEFTSTVPPPVIVIPVTAASANNPVVFAGRTIAEFNLTNPGTLNQLSVQYYSGVNPPLAPDTTKFGNVYFNVTPNGGASGYVYDMTLYFSDGVLGTVESRTNVRMGKSDNNGVSYSAYLTPGTGTGQYVLDTLTNTIKVHGLNTLSIFTITDANAPVPVELSSFAASVNGREVQLNWTTASEINNRGFEVERSLGEEWTKIGYREGKGTTTGKTDYTFSDNFNYTSFEGKISYRLKQIDFDGTYNYSNAIEVEVDFTPKEYALYQNYPNPFNPSTTIKYALPFESNVRIQVYNLLGEMVTELLNSVQEVGFYDLVWNAHSYASGIYFYTINAKSVDGKHDFNTVKKMLLVK